MKKLLFVDHAAHKLTRSSNFFIEILSTRFDVEVFYIEPEREYPSDLIETAKNFDLIVVWQMDYLASIFTIIGIPTVVIPMFDGSELMPDLHWIFGRKASYLNFSLALHHRVRMTGGTSMALRYFRPPVEESRRAEFDGPINAFLWIRRPDHGITLRLVEAFLGGQCDRIHIHHAPDRAEDAGPEHIVPSRDDYQLTVTRWGEDPAAYRNALAECNVFIAPRLTEGIGMAFLEAMARGMLVLAHDRPTHSEYIANWLNGILFSSHTVSTIPFDREQVEEIADMAYLTVVDGHRQWLENIPSMLDFIENTPRPDAVGSFDIDRYARSLFSAYYGGIEYYRHFLTSAASSVLAQLGVSVKGTFDQEANLRPALATIAPGGGELPPMLWNARMDLLSLPDHVAKGKLVVADPVAWITGKSVDLHMNFGIKNPLYRRMNVALRLPAKMKTQTLVVSCNDALVGVFQLSEGNAEISAELPVFQNDLTRTFCLQTTELAKENGIEGLVSLGIERIEFE
ncbi:Glycosyltransferase involved in cell wall bisynthesis [Rhizobium sp. RU20A]|uniref:glycosyltransferase n=1 Tax=Rhizobium sp. RU20A TaxID=1907412 RepID=UPI0009566B74|nr:glycosyltransferase [Rhizobium sp. RU20A]SIQ58905.1 Glycosyltransferase involved in cell wall bisynthesis [Rhizobium sp. RU20A]